MDFKQRYKQIFPYPFLIFGLLFFLFFFAAQLNNHRFWLNDFRVYYEAAREFFAGNSCYGKPFGLDSGFYKYSPIALIPFYPLSLLPFKVAAVCYYFIMLVGFLWLFRHLLIYFDSKYPEIKWNRYAFLAFLICVNHFYREFHLGNINMLLLLLMLLALRFIMEGKELFAGSIIALAILFKLHFLIFIPWLIVRRRWHTLVAIFTTLAFGLLIPFIWMGVDGYNDLIRQWFAIIQVHNVSPIEHQDTIYFQFNQVFGLLNIPVSSKILILLVLGLVASSFLALILRNFKWEQSNIRLRSFHFRLEFFVLLALVPSLTVTDTEHFLLALPLIFYSILIFIRLSFTSVWKYLIVLSWLLYGANWHDLLGATFSKTVASVGTLGLGNFLLVLILCIVTVWCCDNTGCLKKKGGILRTPIIQ